MSFAKKRVGLTQRLPVLLQQTSGSYAGQPARPSAPPAETVDGQRGTISAGRKDRGGAKFCLECGKPTDSHGTEPARFASPQSYTPQHLAEKILTSKATLEGERKQVTVLFADLRAPWSCSPTATPRRRGSFSIRVASSRRRHIATIEHRLAVHHILDPEPVGRAGPPGGAFAIAT